MSRMMRPSLWAEAEVLKQAPTMIKAASATCEVLRNFMMIPWLCPLASFRREAAVLNMDRTIPIRTDPILSGQ